jgi:hypothetical protein
MCVCVLLQFVLLRIIQCQTSVAGGILFFHWILFSPAICPLESLSNAQHQLQLAGIIFFRSTVLFFPSPILTLENCLTPNMSLELLFSSNWDCYYYFFQTWLFASIPNARSTFGLLVGSTFCCFAPLLTLQRVGYWESIMITTTTIPYFSIIIVLCLSDTYILS